MNHLEEAKNKYIQAREVAPNSFYGYYANITDAGVNALIAIAEGAHRVAEQLEKIANNSPPQYREEWDELGVTKTYVPVED